MSELQNVRADVENYLAGRISLATLKSWVEPLVWGGGDVDLSTADIAPQVAELLSDHSNGRLSEDQLRAALRRLV